MKTGISKAWLLVERDRPVLRYNVLVTDFPLCSSLSARHSFLTAGTDCLAPLSRCRDLSVHFERRARWNARCARASAWARARNAPLGHASGGLPEPELACSVRNARVQPGG